MKGLHNSFHRIILLILLFEGVLSPVFSDELLTVHSHPMIPANPSSSSDSDVLTTSQTQFGLNFFKEILNENPGQNVLISPYSADTALGMIYNGAAGETKDEMTQTLGLGSLALEDFNGANQDQMESLQNADPKIQLQIANSLWGNNDIRFNSDFIQANQNFYKAELHILDFTDPHSADQVNQWVSNKTMGKIPKIIGPLTPLDKLVLVNAVYFKGDWSTQFQKELTKSAPFHLENGSTPDRLFMHQTHDFSYLETDQFQAACLPYGKGRLSLFVFLPSKNSSLSEFCSTLTSDNWSQWMDQFSSRKLILSLPKFKIEFTQGLIPSLQALGMKRAFIRGLADFSGVVDRDHQKGNLYISQAIQKTYLLVDEEGTEAAAATAIVLRANIAIKRQELPPVVMTVDRPFFIALVDKKTKSILFAGAIYDPSNVP